MTINWEIQKDMWAGKTVAIIGNAAFMTNEMADSARVHKTIVVSNAIKFAPWADMFVGLDPCWTDEQKAFKGMKVCGVPTEDLNALYAGMFYESVKIDDNTTIQIRNNTLAAIRIAQKAGAKSIILFGIDDQYDAKHAHTGFTGHNEGLAQIINELSGVGIVVEYAPRAKKIFSVKENAI